MADKVALRVAEAPWEGGLNRPTSSTNVARDNTTLPSSSAQIDKLVRANHTYSPVIGRAEMPRHNPYRGAQLHMLSARIHSNEG